MKLIVLINLQNFLRVHHVVYDDHQQVNVGNVHLKMLENIQENRQKKIIGLETYRVSQYNMIVLNEDCNYVRSNIHNKVMHSVGN